MDRRTTANDSDRELVGGGRWDAVRDYERRPAQGGDPPSRPLLDRLTEMGLGRWVPMSEAGARR